MEEKRTGTWRAWYKSKYVQNILENLFLVVLVLYPLRHIHYGIDWWDTGYNYANFTYMGLEHMDSMWLFSTYLANAVGHLLTLLPFAKGLVGMNLCTGLFVSGMAVAGYFFATRVLRAEKWIAFAGEMAAISLCWCPTALLYNYLGYVLFLAAVMLLYKGLTHNRLPLLFVAGICLGLNIFVRFSNLPQAAMIVAVWVYAALEQRERGRGNNAGEIVRNSFRRALRDTELCVGGYLSAVVAMFVYFQLRYGLSAYFQGIVRLFAMTDNATDYKATSMLMGIVKTYQTNTYWLIRLGLIAGAGMLVWALFYMLTERWGWLEKKKVLCTVLRRLLYVCWGIVSLGTIAWLWKRNFFSLKYYSYDSMIMPGILFLMLTMLIAAVRIFHRKSAKEEKLISGLVILVVLLTSVGSNNNVYPSLNNLFIAAPYTLWECARFVRNVKERRVGKWRLVCSPTPVKGILLAFLGLFLYQSVMFGATFVFAEGTGIRDASVQVAGNEILKGVVMSPERAEWMQQITDYVKENKLTDREVILYGQLPALSYYLQMPSAFNPWSDLRSYNEATMEEDMEEVRLEMEKGERSRPVIIVENTYVQYEKGGRDALMQMGFDEEYIRQIMSDPKWHLIEAFMQDFSYRKTLENEKFAMWE